MDNFMIVGITKKVITAGLTLEKLYI